MLANVLNICSDEELENDGTPTDDGMFVFINSHLGIYLIYGFFFFFFFLYSRYDE